MALAVGILGTIVSLVILGPQIVRLVRTGRSEGVSPTWAVLGICINGGWFAFVVAERIWIALFPDLVAVLAFVLTALALRRNGADFRGTSTMAALATAAMVVVQILGGWEGLGTALALSHAGHYAPAIWTAWRTRIPVALSPATWVLAALEAISWGGYGLLIDNRPFVVFGAVELVAAVAILLRLLLARDRIRAELGGG